MINSILNKVLGTKFRFSKFLKIDNSSELLHTFSVRVSHKEGMNNTISIGKNSLLGVSIVLENKGAQVSIGNNVFIGKSSIICKEKVTLENNILVAWGVTFYDHDSHSLDYEFRREDLEQVIADYKNHKGNFLKNKNWKVVKSKPIRICTDAWIGAESFILKGVTVGKGAIVAARSVVTKDVPPYTVVAGNPARVVKQLKQNK